MLVRENSAALGFRRRTGNQKGIDAPVALEDRHGGCCTPERTGSRSSSSAGITASGFMAGCGTAVLDPLQACRPPGLAINSVETLIGA